ncbi:MaoC family dehydratase [Massilia forsythiae]|uniref:MaoC family dehydratase n=1 Tax=Massilia forsythiae TaxID=2728020 RepID=A0A7Z2VZB8_9BURK|nr:MaoC family dehydratase [Massilia forsythiae]QJE02162.1 MaoC family dehydratase [Massilia forsythiae]
MSTDRPSRFASRPSPKPSAPPSARALPPLNAATLLRALFKRPRRKSGARTPRTVFRLAAIDAVQLRRYRDALGFPGQGIPLTFYYLLAQRAQVATMLDQDFPFRLPGAVHTENALRVETPARPDAPLLLATSVAVQPPAEDGAVYATLDTIGEQDGHTVFACRSTYLMVRGQRARRGNQPHARPAAAALPALAAWRLAGNSGRAYAALSGDWNPIHLWSWSAHLMGMRRPIIHGMHTLARACAELELAGGRPLVALAGRFRAPAPLGSELVLGADLAGGGYVVNSGGRAVAEGSFQLAPE